MMDPRHTPALVALVDACQPEDLPGPALVHWRATTDAIMRLWGECREHAEALALEITLDRLYFGDGFDE